MIAAVLSMLGVSFISAFLPVLPAEPYLVGIVATTSTNAVLLGLAAALGQSMGKLTMFLAARGTLRSPLLRRWHARERNKLDNRNATADNEHPSRLRRFGSWLIKVGSPDKYRVAGPLLLLVSAVIGIPPLIVMTFTAVASKMRTVVFVTTCLVGRTARMLAVALLPGVVGLSIHF